MENRSLVQRLIARPEFGPFVLLVVELVVFWAINPDFLSPLNISNTLAFTVELGLIALAMTLLMTSGEFDLSVGSRVRLRAGADVDALQQRRHVAGGRLRRRPGRRRA